MPLQFSPDRLQQILNHAEQTYPEECCGLLLGTWDRSCPADPKRVIEVWAVPNAWNAEAAEWMGSVMENATLGSGKRDRYWIDPKDLLAAQQYGRDHQLEVIGIYHSHPDHAAMPSECDRVLAWSEYSYIIVSVQQSKAIDWRCWNLDEEQQFRSSEIIIV